MDKKVYSSKLGKEIWIVVNNFFADKLRHSGATETIYTEAEATTLRGGSVELIRAVDDIKIVFQNATVEKVLDIPLEPW